MQYRISDVARVLGITPNALHFFEKENIIQVEKDQSGYRNYSIADVFRLLSYEKYRPWGIRSKQSENNSQMKSITEARLCSALKNKGKKRSIRRLIMPISRK